MEVEIEIVLKRLSLHLAPNLHSSQLPQIRLHIISCEDLAKHVLAVEVGKDIVQHFGVIHYELRPLGRSSIEVYVRKGLSYLPYQDAAQLLYCGLFMALEVLSDAVELIDRHSGCQAGEDVEEEAEAQRVEGEMLSRYVFCLDLSQLDRTAQDDQLMARSVIGFEQFVNFDADFIGDEGIELGKVHIILYDFQQEKERFCDLISASLDDDLTSNNPKISHNFSLPTEHAILLHAIDEDTAFEVIGDVVAEGVRFVACMEGEVRLRLSDSPVMR